MIDLAKVYGILSHLNDRNDDIWRSKGEKKSTAYSHKTWYQYQCNICHVLIVPHVFFFFFFFFFFVFFLCFFFLIIQEDLLRNKNTPIQIYWEFYHQRKRSDEKSDTCNVHISAQNIDCGYLLEPPWQGGSNEYPQSMFLSRNKKINVYPCKPQFYCIKVEFKEIKTI